VPDEDLVFGRKSGRELEPEFEAVSAR
jgi:hypothetical protein